MNVIVRQPSLTDAVGAGMAHYAFLHEELDGRVDDSYWDTHTEESLIEYWHDLFEKPLRGRRIALGVSARRVVAIAALQPSPAIDRDGVNPARPRELTHFAMLHAVFDESAFSRLFDFVLPGIEPVQTWVWRHDQQLRRFLRIHGFTLDGTTILDPDSGVEMSRMVR